MIRVIPKDSQGYGAFNNGEIIENKPVSFPQEGGVGKPFSSLFYWANAIALKDSTIGLHPHQGFEIMSFVLDGEIRHYDTKLSKWIPLQKGDVQIIRSGSGISHSEFMAEGGRMFQIWLDPDLNKTLGKEASYDDYRADDFDVVKSDGIESTYYVGEDGKIELDTPGVNISRVTVESTFSFKNRSEDTTGIYVLSGDLKLKDETLSVDDYVSVESDEELDFKGSGELFILSGLTRQPYTTYIERFRV